MFETLIDARTLSALPPDSVIIADCRFDLAAADAGRTAYFAGHIPGAQYLHLDEDLAEPPAGSNGRHPLPDPARFAERMRQIGLDDGQQLVAYDASGGAFAARLWWLLRSAGHREVAVLDGGFQAWLAEGLWVEKALRTVSPGTFTHRAPDPAATIGANEILADLSDGQMRVIDARSAARFAGSPHPLDPVAGHIPGARNRFYGDNLTSDGRFKPADMLQAEFESVLGGVLPAASVAQCGSGVTACHNLLAMEIAGLGGGRLYPGSWSEWVADPDRPTVPG